MNNYFIKQVEEGKVFNVLCLIHNAYWWNFQKFDKHYENCHVEVYGRGISAFRYNSKTKFQTDYDFDLILHETSAIGLNLDELEKTKKLAQEISLDKQKRVTLGFAYTKPKSERINDEDERLILCSYDNGEEICNEEVICHENLYYPNNFLDIICETHEELDNNKRYVK